MEKIYGIENLLEFIKDRLKEGYTILSCYRDDLRRILEDSKCYGFKDMITLSTGSLTLLLVRRELFEVTYNISPIFVVIEPPLMMIHSIDGILNIVKNWVISNNMANSIWDVDKGRYAYGHFMVEEWSMPLK